MQLNNVLLNNVGDNNDDNVDINDNVYEDTELLFRHLQMSMSQRQTTTVPTPTIVNNCVDNK